MKNQFLCKILSIGIILCAGIAPYAHTVSFPFHGDSLTHIADNPKIRNPLNIKDLWTAYPAPGRLVPFATFAANFAAGGEDPAGYRAVNIAIHALNGLILWMLILTMFQSPRMLADPLTERRYAVALFSALIFLTHPLQTQAVSYVIQRLSPVGGALWIIDAPLLSAGGGWRRGGAYGCSVPAFLGQWPC